MSIEKTTQDATVVDTKPFYKSKIVWLAIATIFLGAVDQLNLLAGQLPTEYQGVITMVLGALTLAARAFSGLSLVKSTDTEK